MDPIQSLLDSLAADPPRLGPLGAATHAEQVLGMPWFVGMTLCPAAPGDTLCNMMIPSDCSVKQTLGLTLVGQGQVALDVRPRGRSFEEESAGEVLSMDAPRRVLTDISPLVPTSVAPGEYEVTFHFAGGPKPSHRSSSEPTRVRLVAATPEQLARRGILEPLRAERGSWRAALRGPTDPRVAAWRLSPSDPFAFPVLSALAEDEDTLRTLSQRDLSGFSWALAPEVGLIHVEWLAATRRREDAREMAASLRAQFPGIGRSLDALGFGER